MPLYEYKCEKCGNNFEYLARSSSELAPKCPKCDAPNPKKQLSAFSTTTTGSSMGASSCPTGTCPLG